jgi:hypothetical protein
MPLPSFLYRGDADPKLLRHVREYWNRGWLQTNLGSGGRGSDIYSAPLIALVEAHVNATWPRTHFLSFSADRAVAESFARGEDSSKALAPAAPDSTEWDTSIFTFDCSRLSAVGKLAEGFLLCRYPHHPQGTVPLSASAIGRMIMDHHRGGVEVPVVLVDVLSALAAADSEDPAVLEAQRKASCDQEWLVLPLEPHTNELNNRVELTALLDDSCISDREKFRLL